MLPTFWFCVSWNCEIFALIPISCFAKFLKIRGKYREITKTKIFAATQTIQEKRWCINTQKHNITIISLLRECRMLIFLSQKAFPRAAKRLKIKMEVLNRNKGCTMVNKTYVNEPRTLSLFLYNTGNTPCGSISKIIIDLSTVVSENCFLTSLAPACLSCCPHQRYLFFLAIVYIQ